MRTLALWVVSLLLGAAVLSNSTVNTIGTDSNGACDAVELIAGATEYNKLTCVGIDLMEEKAYGEAVRYFERALQIPLPEQPNFKLLPRLALAQFHAGDREKAQATLEAAELAVSVFAGVIKCVEGPTGFALIYSSGLPVTSSQEGNIASRMCGAAYDDYYTRTSLESFVRDSEIIRYFFRIGDEIGQSGK